MKSRSLSFILVAAALALGAAAAFAGVDPIAVVQHAVVSHPDVMLGLAGVGAAGITNFVQPGDVLDLDPGAAVPTGTGHLFGAALFGVAVVDAVAGTKSAFITEGVVNIGKTAGLAVAVGDRLFWDPVNNVVNKTVAAQQQVGICTAAALAGDARVTMLLESAVPVAT